MSSPTPSDSHDRPDPSPPRDITNDDDAPDSALLKPPKPSAPQPPAPPRPALRNNFDLEPNPFERSFSVSSNSVTSRNTNQPDDPPESKKSPASSSSSRKHSSNGPDTPKPTLPPLASIASPADSSYTWNLSAGLTSSLRAGPLSPAMLTGPQQTAAGAASHPHQHHAILGAFDAAGGFRTGLTPSTGLTPIVGGPVAFPPPSPNTAAFLAMVNGSGSAGAAASAAATITPNTLSALAGVLQGHAAIAPSQVSAANAAHPLSVSHPPSVFDQSAQQHRYNASSYPLSEQQAQSQQAQPQQYNNAATAATAAANGLFLLSQAHQELTKREEAQKSQSQRQSPEVHAKTNGVNGNGSSTAKRGSKRKSTEAPLPPPPSKSAGGKRARTASTAASGGGGRRYRRESTDSFGDFEGDDDDDDDDDHGDGQDGGQSQSKKPETEEEKRKNFLERNRQAALKCRQRKKAWLTSLQAKVEYLGSENERLSTALVSAREEIARLSSLVGGGVGVGLGAGLGLAHHAHHHHHHPGAHGGGGHGQPVSVSVSLPPGGEAGSAPQSVAAGVGGRGYGY